MVSAECPALVLAPMDGITDASMRELQGEIGAFTYAVSEFIRVSNDALPSKVFRREVPELTSGSKTSTGLPVQIQILGGKPHLMAQTAMNAMRAGATSIDINFGCPAPTVNRNDGGATLLQFPLRIKEVVRAVRGAMPSNFPVSAKLRLGWDDINSIYENAEMAAEGGAAWITIHARTKLQGYSPPVNWKAIQAVRKSLNIPVIANGDIWTFEDFLRCRDETECEHFMIGRGALANPALSHQIARELGINKAEAPDLRWETLFRELIKEIEAVNGKCDKHSLMRLKQWSKLAHLYGDFPFFHQVKLCENLEQFFAILSGDQNKFDVQVREMQPAFG